MPRSYTVSPAVRERGRKGADAVNSTDGLISRLVAKAPPLTPEQADKIRSLLASAAPSGGEQE